MLLGCHNPRQHHHQQNDNQGEAVEGVVEAEATDLPKDLPSAIEKINELRAKRDQMLQQKDKTIMQL